MSDYNWCHGPSCHKQHTQDRIRGGKGAKVLRTRKIKLNQWNENHFFRFFCSNHCYNTFATKYIEQKTISDAFVLMTHEIFNDIKDNIMYNYLAGKMFFSGDFIKGGFS